MMRRGWDHIADPGHRWITQGITGLLKCRTTFKGMGNKTLLKRVLGGVDVMPWQ
jgi:hypothetical protein